MTNHGKILLKALFPLCINLNPHKIKGNYKLIDTEESAYKKRRRAYL